MNQMAMHSCIFFLVLVFGLYSRGETSEASKCNITIRAQIVNAIHRVLPIPLLNPERRAIKSKDNDAYHQ